MAGVTAGGIAGTAAGGIAEMTAEDIAKDIVEDRAAVEDTADGNARRHLAVGIEA